MLKKLYKKALLVGFILTVSGCETVVRNDAPHIGRKIENAKNADKIVTANDLDDYGSVNYYMASEYLNSRNFNEAFEKLNITLKRYPKFPEGYNLMGMIEENLGRFDIAAQNYQKAFKLNPTYAVGYSNYARIYCNRGVDYLQGQANKADRATKPGMYIATAECALMKRQWSMALTNAEQAINLDSNYAQSYLVKALALYQLSQNEQGMRALDVFHNLSGYEQNSLKLGIEMAKRSGNAVAKQKYQQALLNIQPSS